MASYKEQAAEMGLDFADIAEEEYDDEAEPEQANEAYAHVPKKAKTVRFKIDTGASSHFVTNAVPVKDKSQSSMVVHVANGETINVASEGLLSASHKGGERMQLRVNQAKEFKHNLFSVKKAIEQGYVATFTPAGGFLKHEDSAHVIPLVSTRSGWELDLNISKK